MTPLAGYLLLSAFLFAIGLAGALTRRNAIIVLIGIVLLIGLAIFDIIVTIIAMVKANEGVAYRYPLNIRFIK